MPIPWKERWFDDFTVGETAVFGEHLVSEDEIVEFARRYDPQPFHVDPVAAMQSSYGGLIASGWMTGAVMTRLMCAHFLSPSSAMASPGLDELRWLKPVRPGDRLSVRVEVLETSRSRSKPDRGVLRLLQQAVNQDGEVVLSLHGRAMFRCRP